MCKFLTSSAGWMVWLAQRQAHHCFLVSESQDVCAVIWHASCSGMSPLRKADLNVCLKKKSLTTLATYSVCISVLPYIISNCLHPEFF